MVAAAVAGRVGGYSVSLSRLAGSLSAGALGVRAGSALAGSGARLRKCVCGHGADGGGIPAISLLAGRNIPVVRGVHAGCEWSGSGAEHRVFGAYLHSGVSSDAPVL